VKINILILGNNCYQQPLIDEALKSNYKVFVASNTKNPIHI